MVKSLALQVQEAAQGVRKDQKMLFDNIKKLNSYKSSDLNMSFENFSSLKAKSDKMDHNEKKTDQGMNERISELDFSTQLNHERF